MKKKKLSKTKQLLINLGEHFREQGHLFVDFLIGVTDIRYRRAFMEGGAEAVHRRHIYEEQRKMRQLLSALKRQKWIAMRTIGNRIAIVLTEKGEGLLQKERIRNAPPCAKNECVIVIFDIPERERKVREHFRCFLKECDFTQLQQSVWVHRCDVLNEMQSFIRESGSAKWIRVFKAKEVSTKL